MAVSKPILEALQGPGITLAHELSDRLPNVSGDFITPADIVTAAKMGCKHVRIPVDMEIIETDPGTLNADKLLKLRRMIKTCHDNGLITIITPVEVDNLLGQNFTGTIATTKRNAAKTFWTAFATTLASEFGPEKTVFQMADEPLSHATHWGPIQKELTDTIRKAAPNHTLMTANITRYGTTGMDEGAISAMTSAAIRPTDTNTVVSIRPTEFNLFARQLGTYTAPDKIIFARGNPVAQYIAELPWNTNKAGAAKAIDRLKRAFPGESNVNAIQQVEAFASRFTDAENPDGVNDSRLIGQELARIEAFMKSSGLPVVVDTSVFMGGGVEESQRNGFFSDLSVHCAARNIGRIPGTFKGNGFSILKGTGPNTQPDEKAMTAAGFNAALTGPARTLTAGAQDYAVTMCGTSGDDIMRSGNPNGASIAPGEGNNLVILNTATRADVVNVQSGYTTIFRDKAPNANRQQDVIHLPNIASKATLTFRKEGSHLIIADNGKDILKLFEHLDDKNPNRGIPLLVTGNRDKMVAYKLSQKKVNGEYLEQVEITAGLLPPFLNTAPPSRANPVDEGRGCRVEALIGGGAVLLANQVADPEPITRRGPIDFAKRLIGGSSKERS